ncbi:MAG: hypothetical protein ACC661_00620 [Verrucomicrobiales bacterium]
MNESPPQPTLPLPLPLLRAFVPSLLAACFLPGAGIEVAGAQSIQSLAGTSSGSLGAASLGRGQALPRVFAPTQPRIAYTRYPWKRDITSTVFWIGEMPSGNNPTPNHQSSWDGQWAANYGGYDNPDPGARGADYAPKGFTPGLNPFYVALPYNDLLNWRATKPSAARWIPWFRKGFVKHGESVCKDRWVAIRNGSKICYAQWSDCGPFETDDVAYVFGTARPRTSKNNGAGIDISPAVRDFLGLSSGEACDWRFVDLEEVTRGPWCSYGTNNDFVRLQQRQKEVEQNRIAKLRDMRDAWLKQQSLPH